MSQRALARALQVAATRNHARTGDHSGGLPGGHRKDEPGPGQKSALKARRHIATLWTKEPNVKVEIRWCPSHQRIEGNEIADEWAKLAADEPDAHRVEWFSTTNPDGTVSERVFPLPRSFANVKRGFSGRRWQDAKGWARKRLAHTSNRKYRPSDKQKPDPRWPRPTSASPPGFAC